MEENKELQDTQNSPEVNDDTQTSGEPQPQEEFVTKEQLEDLKKRASISSQNYERAKKLEAELNEIRSKKQEKAPSEPQFSAKDFLALSQAGITVEDYDEVVRVSKILNKPLHETLQDKTMKSILSERAEERRTAQMTNVKSGQRGVKKTSDDEILDSARRGALPEDDGDIERLARAQIDGWKKKR